MNKAGVRKKERESNGERDKRDKQLNETISI